MLLWDQADFLLDIQANISCDGYPPNVYVALLTAYEPLVSLNEALLQPVFWGGPVGWGRLTSIIHDMNCVSSVHPEIWGIDTQKPPDLVKESTSKAHPFSTYLFVKFHTGQWLFLIPVTGGR